MKKQLLLGSALFAAISAFSQSGRLLVHPGKDMSAKWTEKFERLNRANEATANQAVQTPAPAGPVAPLQRSSAPLAINWDGISGSMNVYGVLVSSSKPLQYNDELNAVSFVHRKSQYYNPVPVPTPSGAATGVIVANISQDLGLSWDSTAIWNDNNLWARYPQGGIYNPVGNTNLANAYIVGTGPITGQTGGWVGNFFASKQLNTFDNVASTAPNAQQFISSQGPTYGAAEKVDFARIDFTATDDGVVRTLGGIYNNANGTTAAAQAFRGVRIVKGTFSSGAFVWTSDSISLDVNTNSNDGLPIVLGGRFNQAWNDAGTVGYVWYYGSKLGSTGNNIGYQPIIYKTTNSGLTWGAFPSINFNDLATFQKPVLDRLLPTLWDSTQTIPFFNFNEGFDGTVDNNNELHIMTTLWGTTRGDVDSVGYAYTNFTNADNEVYTYAHGYARVWDSTGIHLNKPYIYDFYSRSSTSPATWKVALVDSMSSEAPGEGPADDGFSDNPWDATGEGGTKVSSDARLQMSRTPGGSKIVYTWAESDTGSTNFGRKWNHMNNLKARLMDMNPPYNYAVRSEEFNLTKSAQVTNPYVKDRAQMHNTSPKCVFSPTTATGYTVNVPIKVSNNPNLAQLLPVTHWYSTVPLEFTVAVTNPTVPPTPTTGVSEAAASALTSVLFPNPTKIQSTLYINLKTKGNVEISVLNAVGQVVKSSVVNGQAGENNLPVNVENLAAGIYMVNVRIGDASSTKKLVIE